MTARRLALAALTPALLLSACATPPPPTGLAPPAVTEAGATEGAERTKIGAAPDARLVALRVSVENPPPELLDDQGAGVLTLRRQGEREPIRLVFANDALGVYALRRGIYRLESVAGHRCGDLGFVLGPGDAPLALGGLELGTQDGTGAALAGRLPVPEDLDRIAGLVGAEAEAIDVRPLERRSGIACTRDPRAVSRPDVDPTIRKLTPAEIAGTIALVGLLGAATGGAIAAGSVVFVSGSAGGLLFLGL